VADEPAPVDTTTIEAALRLVAFTESPKRGMTRVMTIVMNQSPNRRLDRGALRRRISGVAIELFREHGYDRVSVDKIVAGASVAKGTFFNFFPSKIDVLLEAYSDLDSRLRQRRAAIDPRDPRRGLAGFVAEAEALMREDGELLQVLVRELSARPKLRGEDMQSAARDRAEFAAVFARAQSAGALPAGFDAQIAGAVVGDLWTAAVVAWASQPDRPFAADLNAKLGLLFDGLERLA
jgi:AcrR family transcriptional regulator